MLPLLLLALQFQQLPADEIEMKTGNVIKGTVLLQDENSVQVQVGTSIVNLPRSMIVSMKIATVEENLLEEARLAAAADQDLKAYDRYSEFLRLNPTNTEVEREFAALQDKIRKGISSEFYKELSTRDYDTIIRGVQAKISPDRPIPPSMHFLRQILSEYYVLRARDYYNNLRFKEAQEDLKLAISSNPNQLDSCYLLAKIYYENLNSPRDAQPLIDKVCREAPTPTVEQRILQLQCKLHLGEFNAATETFNQLLADEQKNPGLSSGARQRLLGAVWQLVEVFEKRDEREKAIKSFQLWFNSFDKNDKDRRKILELAADFYQRNEMFTEWQEIKNLLDNIESTERLLASFKRNTPTAIVITSEELGPAAFGFASVDNSRRAMVMAAGTGKLILIFFHGIACAQCDEFKQVHLRDEAFRTALGNDFVLLQIDMDNEANAELLRQFNPRRRPEFIIADQHARELGRLQIQGTLPNPQEFIKLLDEYAKSRL